VSWKADLEAHFIQLNLFPANNDAMWDALFTMDTFSLILSFLSRTEQRHLFLVCKPWLKCLVGLQSNLLPTALCEEIPQIGKIASSISLPMPEEWYDYYGKYETSDTLCTLSDFNLIFSLLEFEKFLTLLDSILYQKQPLKMLHWLPYFSLLHKEVKTVNYSNKKKLEKAAISCTIMAYFDTLKFLLQLGTDPNVIWQCGGKTLLHLAAENHLDRIMKLVLEAGANTEIRNNASETPLFQAALSGDEKMIKILLQAGANANVVSLMDSATPLDSAVQSGNLNAVSLLRKAMDQNEILEIIK